MWVSDVRDERALRARIVIVSNTLSRTLIELCCTSVGRTKPSNNLDVLPEIDLWNHQHRKRTARQCPELPLAELTPYATRGQGETASLHNDRRGLRAAV